MQLEPGQAQQLAALIDYQDDHRSDRLERLREAFDRTGIRAEIPEDIDAALGQKFLFVISVGGVGAVTRAPIGVFREMPETPRLLEGAMQEIFHVARAGRRPLSSHAVEPDSCHQVDPTPYPRGDAR
ncbi:MAG: ketopantoate reductase C-terminal domain-containing protein [Gemmatimonadales bacterium]